MVVDPSTRLLLVVLQVFTWGGIVASAFSGNLIGAAVWTFAALCITAALVVTRPLR